MNRKLLVAAVSGALALPMAAQAVEFSASGHVNRAIVIMDDGTNNNVQNQEGTASGSRFRFTGSDDLGNGLTAGFRAEVGLDGAGGAPRIPGTNEASGGLNDDGSNAAGAAADDPVRLRQVNVYLSGAFGAVTLGQQSHGNDITQYASLDNYAWLGGIEAGCDFGCGFNFRDSDTGMLTEYTPGSFQIWSKFRDDLIRYDSPALGPASVSVSAGNNDYYDLSVSVAGDAGNMSYQLLAGTSHDSDGSEQIEMSAAAGLSQGTHAAFGWATDEVPGQTSAQDPTTWHAVLGHNFGNSSVAVIYYNSEDVYGDEMDGNSWGVGFGHAFPDQAVQVYASYRMWEADIPNRRTDDVSVFVIGSRIQFN
jgi:predicted porin